ncbi:hypothetical protein COU13_00460 [Candidatus Kaiserbacteria bacterium CG10_big_fil_rev_8_21_14_0_10_43_70]|uniref:Uncharacterized protein n=1 Tax=Candidatus Kaiserbacteria bacterium CG10_big_fil_rev_8_21_14_0_10_43_70 TaxID=1974605 RepID=A0A2H0UJF3_9BACT|nr:MAG: hypothetical protein COU13_00460 [Candidatus Kaiserbacteria bacterium CG10_big_fil_rev_8_21_14_0_10_43_70]
MTGTPAGKKEKCQRGHDKQNAFEGMIRLRRRLKKHQASHKQCNAEQPEKEKGKELHGALLFKLNRDSPLNPLKAK